MISTLGLEPIKFKFKVEQDQENATIFFIKPMNYKDFQNDVKQVELSNEKGVVKVVNPDKVEKDYFKKYIVKIENIEHKGKVIEVVEDKELILEIIYTLPHELGNELKEGIETASTLTNKELKN